MNRDNLRELTVFVLLLAIGVIGRWYAPAWNFTPLAAVTVVGGYYFRQLLPAVLLPIGVLTVSNILLPSYSFWQVHLAVYTAMLLPLVLGRASRGAEGWHQAKYFAICGFLPATVFYIFTNFVHWAVTPDYAKSVAGLVNCYVAGLPFYRWMLAGDLFFLGIFVGCLAIARSLARQSSAKRAL